MSAIHRYGSDSPWEDQVAYSRVVRHGNYISVAGTTAVIDGAIVGKGNAYEQAMCIFKKIQMAIEKAGGSMEGILRTRIYVSHIQRDWEAIGRAHKAFFDPHRPVATMVEVQALIDPDLLLEVEAEAVIEYNE